MRVMTYDDPGDSQAEDKGALFAYGMYLFSKNSPMPAEPLIVKAGWRYAATLTAVAVKGALK